MIPIKRSSLFLLILLCLSCWASEKGSRFSQDASQLVQASPQASTGRDTVAVKETLINLEKQSWEAWKKRDGKFFQEFLAEDHVELGFNGAATKVQVVAFVASPVCVINSYSIDQFELKMISTSVALLTYHAVQDTTCSGVTVPSPVWASSLYVRRGDHWLNA